MTVRSLHRPVALAGVVALLLGACSGSSDGATEAESERTDSGQAIVGFGPQKVAKAIAFFNHYGG
jgi:hypothetical protein